jgi:hypothetical protein
MQAIMGLKPGETWSAFSDLGWVVGHSFICYGPLLNRNTTVIYEGKPVGTPDSGAVFRVISEHKVNAMFIGWLIILELIIGFHLESFIFYSFTLFNSTHGTQSYSSARSRCFTRQKISN